MEAVIPYILLIGPIFIAPAYWLITRKQKEAQSIIRVILWLIFVLHLLAALPLLVELPYLLRTYVGRFDDYMYGLLAIGMLSGAASMLIIIFGNVIAFVVRKNVAPGK
ncbi:hypothetical protein L0244_33690 [bacterium]|nr:hypothetical protein [bacterium]